MASAALSALVEVVGYISYHYSTMNRSEEILRDIGISEYPDEWEASYDAWTEANTTSPTGQLSRKLALAYNTHIGASKTQAASEIWAVGRSEYGEAVWKVVCPRRH